MLRLRDPCSQFGRVHFQRHTGGNGISGFHGSLFGGANVGRTIELVPDRRIVQAWRDSDWGPGIYSIAMFELSAAGPGTHLVFHQGAYPLSDYASLVSGWHSHYWEPIKKYFLTSK